MSRFVTAVAGALSTSIGASSAPLPDLSQARLPETTGKEVIPDSPQSRQFKSFVLENHDTARLILAPFEDKVMPSKDEILDRLTALADIRYGISDTGRLRIERSDQMLMTITTELAKLSPNEREKLAESIQALVESETAERNIRTLVQREKSFRRMNLPDTEPHLIKVIDELVALTATEKSAWFSLLRDFFGSSLSSYACFARVVEDTVNHKQWAQFRDNLTPSVRELYAKLPSVTREILAPWRDSDSAPKFSDLIKRIKDLATSKERGALMTFSRARAELVLSTVAQTPEQQGELAEAILADLKLRTVETELEGVKHVINQVNHCVDDGAQMSNHLFNIVAFAGQLETYALELSERAAPVLEVEELGASVKVPTDPAVIESKK